MNKEQTLGFIRHGLTLVGGFFVARGVLDEGQLLEVVGALISLIGFGWSFFVKR